jgi:hypothetical protein
MIPFCPSTTKEELSVSTRARGDDEYSTCSCT